jgi:hypothetical protein
MAEGAHGLDVVFGATIGRKLMLGELLTPAELDSICDICDGMDDTQFTYMMNTGIAGTSQPVRDYRTSLIYYGSILEYRLLRRVYGVEYILARQDNGAFGSRWMIVTGHQQRDDQMTLDPMVWEISDHFHQAGHTTRYVLAMAITAMCLNNIT